jgi:endonuclease/exonuclease/phosphatase family metal-dependent hydrolase
MQKVLLLLIWIAQTAAAQTITIMTYNIRYDNPGDGVNTWSNRKGKVTDLIKKYDPDILGVQEALNNQLGDIVSVLTDYDFIGVGRDDGKTKGEYSAILYKKNRFDVLQQNTFWLSETPEVPGSKNWDAAITRVATWARFKDRQTQKEFLVINTHFDHIGREARKKSAELLKARAAAMHGNLPVIITGDFNCTPDEDPYKTMMNPAGLQLTDSAPNDHPGTACGFEVNPAKCKPIDYIFYSKPWIIEKYAVIYDNDGKYYPSDHVPVTAKAVLK